MAYSKTWNTDRAGYDFFGSRAMNKVETQAAAQWSVGANNTWKQANPWVCSGTTRAFGTLYKNNTSNPVLVMATIDVQGVQNALGSGAASASIEVYDTGGTLLFEVGRVGSGATTVALATVDLFSQLFAIVNPTEQYKLVNTTGAGTGTITIVTVTEFAFDAKYTAQTWAHLEQPAVAKYNVYAAGVNRIPPKDEAFAYGSSGTVAAGASEVMGDKVTLELYNYSISFFNILTGTGGKRVFDLKNSGGSALQVSALGAILGGAAEIGGGILMGAVLSNAGGTIHNVETGTGGTLTGRKIGFVAPSYTDILFTNGETGAGAAGSATGNKFRNLDTRASKGANMGSPMTHATITVGSPTTIASISTAWRLVTVALSFGTNLLTNAVLTIAVDGTTIITLQNTSAGNMTFQSMALFLLPAGSSATITASGTMTVDRIHAWTVQ